MDTTNTTKKSSEDGKNTENVPMCFLERQMGGIKKATGPSKHLEIYAERKLISRDHDEFECKFPDIARSTFLMVFSADRKLIASTHGNRNVYVSDLSTGKHIKTLTGHPRTPWSIAFHPSTNQILASGCLGGQVRVWDLHGGSEIWTAESQTVIASLAFHPTDHVLVIASYNEVHFWDWSQEKPFAKCSTSNEREKVRYVSFDRYGHKLITGVGNAPRITTQWDRYSIPAQFAPYDQDGVVAIYYSYMVEQYERLVDRYIRLSNMSSGPPVTERSRSTNQRPRQTMDRGTDPMEANELNQSAERPVARCAVCLVDINPTWNTRRCVTSPCPSTSTSTPTTSTAGTALPSTSSSTSSPTPSSSTAPIAPTPSTSSNVSSNPTSDPSVTSSTNPSAYVYVSSTLTSTSRGESSIRRAALRSEDRRRLIVRLRDLRRRNAGTDAVSASLSSTNTSNRLPHFNALNILTNPRRRQSGSRSESSQETSQSPQLGSTSGSPAERIMRGNLLIIDDFLGRRLNEDRNSSNRRYENSAMAMLRAQFRRLQTVYNNRDRTPLLRQLFREADRLPSTDNPPSEDGVPVLTGYRVSSETWDSNTSETPPTDRPSTENNLFSSDSRFSAFSSEARSSAFTPTTSTSTQSSQSRALRNMHYRIQLVNQHIENIATENRSNLEEDQIERIRGLWDLLQGQIRTLQNEVRETNTETNNTTETGTSVNNENQSTTTPTTPATPTHATPTTPASPTTPATPTTPAVPDTPAVPATPVSGGHSMSSESASSSANCACTICALTARTPPQVPRSLVDDPQSGNSNSRVVRIRISPVLPRRTSAPCPNENTTTPSASGRNGFQRRKCTMARQNQPLLKRPRFDSTPNRRARPDVYGHSSRTSPSTSTEPQNTDRAQSGPSTPDQPVRNIRCRFLYHSTCACGHHRPNQPSPSAEQSTPTSENQAPANPPETSTTPANSASMNPPTSERPSTAGGANPQNQESSRDTSRRNFSPWHHDAVRNRARHVLPLMVEGLSQFFENDSTPSTREPSETFTQRISSLINLLGLALSLSGALITQLEMSRRERLRWVEIQEEFHARRGGVNAHSPSGDAVNFGSNNGQGRRNTISARTDIINQVQTGENRSSIRPPLLRVNDQPVVDDPSEIYPSYPLFFPQAIRPRGGRRIDAIQQPTSRPRYLHPRYFPPQYVYDVLDNEIIVNPKAPLHRIQVWDFTKFVLPEIQDSEKNLVVNECKIHNDASVDVSSDGDLLVTLLSSRFSISTRLGVYSLNWNTLGQCLYTTSFDQSAVSVSLSPTSRHLMVGLATRRICFFQSEKQTIARIYELVKPHDDSEATKDSPSSPNAASSNGVLALIRDLKMSREPTDFVSLNCIRWAPTAGEGFVYATNAGRLKILR